MKRIILAVVVALGTFAAAQAQKFALVDMEYILQNIPSYEMANEQLNQASQRWQKEVENISREAETMYKNYQADMVFLTDEQKKTREAEIVAKEKEAVELRNKYFKGCRGRKDISYLPWARDGPSTECTVFEGFIDYLSAIALGIISGADAIILNSVVNVNKVVPYLKDYNAINCYLDNDNAGQSALAELTAIYGSAVIDRSTLYSEFNDLNDFLVNRSFTKNTLSNENK